MMNPPVCRAVAAAARLLLAVCCAVTAPLTQAQRAGQADPTDLNLEQLLGVTVTGASKYEQRQAEVAAAVSVITRREIQAYGWRTLDQALASLPGVYVTFDRQYAYLGTRGFGMPGDFNTRLLVTINGNRQNDPNFDGGAMGRQLPLDLDLVERIEFFPGPGGAVYGQNAMFGVVNIVTRSADSVGGAEAVLAGQSPQRLREGRLSWGGRLPGGVEALLSVSALKAGGQDLAMLFPGAPVAAGTARGLDGERDKELFVRLGRGPWSFDLVYGDHAKDDPTGAYLADPLVPGQYQGDRYTLAQLQFQDRFGGDTLDLLGRVFVGRERYDSRLRYGTVYEPVQQAGTLYAFPAPSEWQGLELRLVSSALAGHKLMLGLEAQDDRRRDQSILDLSDPANNIIIAGKGYRYGLYVQDEWRLAPAWSATFGLRLDRADGTGTKTSPRVAVIWQAQQATTLKLLAGRAHRKPNAYERDYDDGFAQVGNPGLRGERIDTLELVADHRAGSELALRASAYRWAMRDIVTLGIDPVSGLTQYQSGTPIHATGLELSADRAWPGGARLRASASLQDVAEVNGGALQNSPRLLARLNLAAPLPWAGAQLGYEWRFDGSRLARDGSRLGGHAVSNLRLGLPALAGRLGLSLTVTNLLDKRHAHPAADSNWQNAFAQDGRAWRVQADYGF